MLRNDENKLTIKELKQFKGLENLTETEANDIIDILFTLSVVAHEEIINNLKN